MKLTKLFVCTTSLLTIITTDAHAVQRISKTEFYREEFDPYQHPRSLANLKDRERLKKPEMVAPAPAPVIPQATIPQYQPPQQAVRNVAPSVAEIYSPAELQTRRPVNIYGSNIQSPAMMKMQNTYMATPIMTPQATLQQPMAPAYRGELESIDTESERNIYSPGISITPKVGTQGIGLEIGTAFNEYIGARTGVNYAKYSDGDEINNIDYDYDVNVLNANALIDVRPFANGFRMTGGAYFQPDEVEFSATPAGSESINGTTYTASEIGRIDGKVETGDISPYAGIGFSRAFTKTSNWFFDTDLGVKFNDISTNITSNGTLAGDATFDADLQAEKQKVQDKFDAIEYYPIFNIGFGYKF